MLELWRHQLHAWGEFYVIVGGGAAALTGLMFVVVSIAPQTIIKRTSKAIRAFITPTVVYFATVLVGAGFMTMPTLTPAVLSALLVLGGIIGLSYMVWIGVHRQWRESTLERDDWLWYVGLPFLGYVVLIAAALSMWLDDELALEAVALAMILFLVTGIRNAWDLVLWMAQQPRSPDAKDPAIDERHPGG